MRTADHPITTRQLHVIAEAARGGSYQEIATTLGVTAETVHTHAQLAGRNLGVSSQLAVLVDALYQRGILTAGIADGRASRRLTGRRREVLTLIAQGLTDAQIGRALFVTECTVKRHVQLLRRDLGARNRYHAVALGYQLGHLKAPAVDPHAACEQLPCDGGCGTSVDECARAGQDFDAPVMCEDCTAIPSNLREHRAYAYH